VRKHKEWLLVGKLADVIKADVREKFPDASSDVIERKQKERVMELYINFIYLGNQTYGIEAAAQSYFGKSAKDLSIVESSILASMPQSPSYYNPYKNPKRVI
jgi:membrane carboxypeptidase/penicillin-binding protein